MNKLITKTRGVCGGRACIANSRIPVYIIEEYRRAGFTEKIPLAYPHLRMEQILAALDYATSHPQEMERDMKE
jgi:uncharacterized protein (DUF433 family)